MGATIKDIAKKTGLGLATISSYLNGGNVRRQNQIIIEKAIKELHFEVNEFARGLKTNKSKTIGIIIPELGNIFCSEIITVIEDALRARGYAVIICDCRTDEQREAEAIQFLLHRRVDGLIIIPTAKTEEALRSHIPDGKPVVLVDRMPQGTKLSDCVLVDNRNAARSAVKRLIAKGHRRIGMISGPAQIYTSEERQKGYLEAMESAGLEDGQDWIVSGEYTISGGMAAMKRLIEQHTDITAVFISNYEMTVGGVIAINELGLVIPDELALVGFDDKIFAMATTPKLSIVTQPVAEIAKAAVGLMLEKLKTPPEQWRQRLVQLDTGFVEGSSIGKREAEQL